jgi:formylmethanofuran dehydrogenase subunit B
LKGDFEETDRRGTIGGIEKEDLRQIANRLKEAKYGTLFYGMGLTMTRGKYMNTWVAMNLIRELNMYTRFIMIPMRGHGNVAGIDSVMAWQTGYPYAVNFSRSYPRYNPGEYTAVDLLGRGEVDAALVFAADPAANFPFAAVDYLAKIPSIVIDPHRNMSSEIAEVVIPSGITGITAPGTVYRMDNVPLRVRPMLKDGWPTDEEILREIEERIAQ